MRTPFIAKRCHGKPGLKPKRGCERGWSMVELLVVITIIAVLGSVVFALSKRGLDSARAATCMSNVKQIGAALLMHAADNHNKLIPLQPSENRETGKRPPIWTVQLAQAGYLWDGNGELPCGTGVWTCPECDFMGNTYGGFGVVEGAVFVYEENRPDGVSEPGSLRLNRIADPARTWLLGEASRNAADEPNKGWYAIWSDPGQWNTHGPAARHGGKVNVCMVDGHVERLTVREIERKKLTEDVTMSRR